MTRKFNLTLFSDASKQKVKSRQSSLLEINTGDSRYVLAYTLKPASDCTPATQFTTMSSSPDILNTPRGEY